MLVKELVEFCRSESLSEDGLREIIERYGLTPGDINNTLSNYEFFLVACQHERVTEGIIRCLIKYFPTAASATHKFGWTPLHVACGNKSITRVIIQLLIDAAPDPFCSVNNIGRLFLGYMPLHILCRRDDITEVVEILKLLIEKYPEAVRHADNAGELPIHSAAKNQSPEFCRVLIEAYPGSERIASDEDEHELPLHNACRYNTVATVKYLYNLYPDAVNHASTDGYYPIHSAIIGLSESDNPAAAMEIVHFLLDCDPNVKLQKWEGHSLLSIACHLNYDDSNIEIGIEVIKAIYDAHPEAIENFDIISTIHECHQHVQAFINTQLVYARQANDHEEMTTPDGNGQLPLHRALQNNDIRLGSIKLLVKGNPRALQSPDNSGVLPFHIACQHHDFTDVVRYLIDIDTTSLGAVDRDGNTVLHHACRGAKYGTIAMLLEVYDAVSVSRKNAHGKLPIDLLWGSNEVEDRNGCEYVESIFCLLRAYPETVMITMMNEQARAGHCSTQNMRKRKFGK